MVKKPIVRRIATFILLCLIVQVFPVGVTQAEESKAYSEAPTESHLVSNGASVNVLNGMVFHEGDPANLTDGKADTLTGGYGLVDFYVDLGRKLPLTYVNISFSRMWDGVNTVYVSDDAQSWQQVIAGSGSQYEYIKDTAATNGETQPNEFGALLPEGTEGRYVRISTKDWANFYELRVYSSQEVAAPNTDYSEAPSGLRIVSTGAQVTGYNGMKFNDGDPVNLTDGNPATMAGGYGLVDMYVDLGRKLKLDYVKVLFNRMWHGTNKLYVSDDAVHWTAVLSGNGAEYDYMKDKTATDGERQPNELGALLPEGTEGRYVRLTARDWANVYEWQVYSSQPIAAESILVRGPAKLEVVNGLSMKMNAEVQPSTATESSVTWSVYAKNGSPGAAVIDPATGLLTAKSPGIVTVEATAADGSGITGSTDVVILPEAEVWREIEMAFESGKSYGDPFLDVDVTATFTGPNGEVLTRPAFWDGGNTWKVRFAPTAPGKWKVTTVSNDIGDEGLNRTAPVAFTAVPYEGTLEIYKRGFLTTGENKRYFMYHDQTPFFYLGDTHWLMPDEEFESSNVDGIDSQFKYAVDHRVSQGYTVYQSEPLYANGIGLNVARGIQSDSLAKLADIDRKFQYVADAGLVHANAALTFHSVLNVTDPDLLQRLGRYWQARYGAYPVLWTTAQEVDPPVFNSDDKYWHFVAQGIHDSDSYKQPLTAHMAVVPTFETTWGDKPYHSWFAAQILTFTKELFASYMAFPIIKPIITYESAYEHNGVTSDKARTAPYIAFQNGSFGFGYGAQGVWAIQHSPDDWFHYGPYYRWFDGLQATAGSQMTYFKRFYSDMEWWKLTPVFSDTSYADFAADAQSFLSTIGNHTYVAYFADSSKKTGKLKRMGNTTYKAQWYNTRTGEYTLISDQVVPINGEWIVPEKPDKQDWILLVASAQSAVAPKLTVSSENNATTIFTQHGKLQMTANLAGSDRTNDVNWSVVNPDGSVTDLASIDASGMLTAMDNGIVRVTAVAKDGSGMAASKTVILARQDKSEPPALARHITIKDGGNRQLLAYFDPDDSLNQLVEWAVYEPDGVTPTDKAKISDMGVLQLFQEGAVKVVATALDGSGVSGAYDYTIAFNDVIVNPLFEGATVTASTTDYVNDYRPIKAITSQHGNWTGWTSGLDEKTSYDNPQWLEVQFKQPTAFNHVEIYSTSGFQMKDFDVQYWDGGQWLPLYSVKGNGSEAVKALIPEVLTEKIRVICYKGDSLGIARVSAIEVYMDSESHDARLKGIAVDGSSLAGFDSGKTSYDLQLPAGTTAVPAVTAASMHQNAEVTVTQAESTTGKAVIQVTAEDGITKSVYEIRFSVASIVNPQQPGSGTGTNQGTDPGKVPDPDKDPDTKPDDSGVKVTLSDVPVGHWAADSIRKAAGLGIITGYKDGTFKPDREVSRAEFIAMLARALKLPTDGASAVTFADAGSIASWAQPYVAQAAQNGLITGFADGTFRPLATINRAELSALLVRASGLQVPSDVEASSLSFNDVDQIPKWAVRYAAIAVDKGLLQGVSGNRFDATGIVTRAQAAVAIMRLLNE